MMHGKHAPRCPKSNSLSLSVGGSGRRLTLRSTSRRTTSVRSRQTFPHFCSLTRFCRLRWSRPHPSETRVRSIELAKMDGGSFLQVHPSCKESSGRKGHPYGGLLCHQSRLCCGSTASPTNPTPCASAVPRSRSPAACLSQWRTSHSSPIAG